MKDPPSDGLPRGMKLTAPVCGCWAEVALTWVKTELVEVGSGSRSSSSRSAGEHKESNAVLYVMEGWLGQSKDLERPL